MKNNFIKRLISAGLAAVMLSGMTISAGAKETMFGPREDWLITEPYIDDVFKYDYETIKADSGAEDLNREIQDIVFLGIMDYEESGLFEPEKPVTAKEFGEAMVKLIYDKSSVNYLNNYKGSESVTLETAVTVLLDMMGYAAWAEVKGQNGYVTMARRLELLDGIGYSGMKEFINKGQLARLIYNSLDKDMAKVTSADSTGLNYEVAEGMNLLFETFEMVKLEGFFNGMPGVNIYSADEVDEGFIQIDRLNYTYKDESVKALFGKYVDGYAKYDKNKKRYDIALIREKDSADASRTYNMRDGYISGSDIIFESEDKKTERFSVDALEYMVYNGDFVPKNQHRSKFNSNSAFVTFASSKDDGRYDVAVIKDFKTYPIKFGNTTDYRIIFDYYLTFRNDTTDDPYFQLDKDEYYNIYGENGKELGLDELGGGKIASFFKNSDGSYTEVAVSSKQLDGKIVKISNNEYIFDNGESYPVAATYLTAVSNKKATPLEIGLEGTFGISYDGTIASYEGGRSLKYGYLRTSGYDSKAVFDTIYQLKIFNEKGKWEILQLADKLTFNGKKGETKDNAALVLESLADSKRMIRYNTNKDGKIIFLDTTELHSDIDAGEIYSADEANDSERLVLRWSKTGLRANWSQGLSWPGCPGKISSSTLIFNIPADKTKEKFYSVTSNSVFVDEQDYNVDFYSPNNFNLCSVAVITDNSGGVGASSYQGSHFLGVESLVKVYDGETGDVRYAVSGWIWGRTHTYGEWMLHEDYLDLNGGVLPKEGGVYRYVLSGNDIKNLDLLVDANVSKLDEDYEINAGASYERMVGTIVDIVDGFIKIRVNGNDWVFTSHEGTYMEYRKSTQKFNKLTYADVYIGERIYIYGAVENAGGMLVVRN